MKNMKKNTKDNIISGVSAAMGAAAGFSATVNAAAHTQEAQTTNEVEVIDAVDVETATHNVNTVPEQEVEITDISHSSYTAHPAQTTTADTNNSQTPQEISHEDNTPEIEVLGYERITDEVGNRMDAAVVSDHGHKITYLDTDLDNEANIKWTDFNNNDIPDAGELQNIEGQHVDMHVFQQAAEYNPLYAQNDMPDYDNDANVGTLLG